MFNDLPILVNQWVSNFTTNQCTVSYFADRSIRRDIHSKYEGNLGSNNGFKCNFLMQLTNHPVHKLVNRKLVRQQNASYPSWVKNRHIPANRNSILHSHASYISAGPAALADYYGLKSRTDTSVKNSLSSVRLRCSLIVHERHENTRAAGAPWTSESSDHVHSLSSNTVVLHIQRLYVVDWFISYGSQRQD